jgi:hypothetical protein
MNKPKVKIHQYLRRAGEKNSHHILRPQRGGMNVVSNLLEIDIYRHDALHLLFEYKTLREIIALLKNYNSNKDFLRSINHYYKHLAFRLLFGNKKLPEIITLLQRVQRAKDTQWIKLKLTA